MEEIELVDEDVRFSLPAELIGHRFDERAGYKSASTLEAAAAQADAPRGWRTWPGCRQPDGHWCAELTADTTLESDYILFQLWLHPPQDGVWKPPTRPLIEKAVRSILERQLPDGGFNIYVDGPVGSQRLGEGLFRAETGRRAGRTIRAWRALRERILELGGIQAANSYVKVNLSLFGLYPREHCPAFRRKWCCCRSIFCTRCPPGRAPSWSRSPSCTRRSAPAGAGGLPSGRDLAARRQPRVPAAIRAGSPGATCFCTADRLLKLWERHGFARICGARPSQSAEHWMLERMQHSDGLGAIYPPMMYSVMALDVLGYAPDHPLRVEALRQFEQPDGGRRRALLLPAVLLAGLGHGHRGLRAGRSRRSTHGRRCAARPTGCWRGKSGARATGR